MAHHYSHMKNAYWFIFAAVVLGLSFLVKSPYVAYAVYAFLLLVLLANLSSRMWLTGLEVTRELSADTVRQGEAVEISVKVSNRRGFPIPWLFIEDLLPPFFHRTGDNTRLAILMPGRSITLNYSVHCAARGYHRVGPLLLESGDLFGLQKRFVTGQQQDYLSVLPTVAYIETFNVSTKRPQGPVRVSHRIYEDPTRISGLREYVPGDPLRSIHWKASARTGELYVKQNEPSTVLGATLILDFHRDSYQGEDAGERRELAVTTAASIAYLLQMSGEQLGLLTNARDAAEVAHYEVEARQALSRAEAGERVVGEGNSTRLSPLTVATRRSPVQAQQIVENLARVVPSDGLDVGTLIRTEFMRLPRDAALIPVVPRVDGDMALVLAEMKLSGFAVTVFLIDNNRNYAEAAGNLAPHGIHVFHIEEARDLHEIAPQRIGQ